MIKCESLIPKVREWPGPGCCAPWGTGSGNPCHHHRDFHSVCLCLSSASCLLLMHLCFLSLFMPAPLLKGPVIQEPLCVHSSLPSSLGCCHLTILPSLCQLLSCLALLTQPELDPCLSLPSGCLSGLESALRMPWAPRSPREKGTSLEPAL